MRSTACGSMAPTSRIPVDAQPARPAQRAQRAGGDRGGHRGAALPTRRSSRRWPSSTASAGVSSATATCRCRPGRRGPATLIDDYGHHPVEMAATIAAARGAFPTNAWCWPSSPIATPGRGPVRGFRQGAVPSMRCCWAKSTGRRGADRRCRRPLAGAPVRVAGKVEPVFVENIAGHAAGDPVCPRADGDVVITMGAGQHRRRAASSPAPRSPRRRPGSEGCGAVRRFVCRAREFR